MAVGFYGYQRLDFARRDTLIRLPVGLFLKALAVPRVVIRPTNLYLDGVEPAITRAA